MIVLAVRANKSYRNAVSGGGGGWREGGVSMNYSLCCYFFDLETDSQSDWLPLISAATLVREGVCIFVFVCVFMSVCDTLEVMSTLYLQYNFSPGINTSQTLPPPRHKSKRNLQGNSLQHSSWSGETPQSMHSFRSTSWVTSGGWLIGTYCSALFASTGICSTRPR